MTVYVLTEGWYADMEVMGVVDDLSQAEAWVNSFKPCYEGECNTRGSYSFEMGDIKEDE